MNLISLISFDLELLLIILLVADRISLNDPAILSENVKVLVAYDEN